MTTNNWREEFERQFPIDEDQLTQRAIQNARLEGRTGAEIFISNKHRKLMAHVERENLLHFIETQIALARKEGAEEMKKKVENLIDDTDDYQLFVWDFEKL